MSARDRIVDRNGLAELVARTARRRLHVQLKHAGRRGKLEPVVMRSAVVFRYRARQTALYRDVDSPLRRLFAVADGERNGHARAYAPRLYRNVYRPSAVCGAFRLRLAVEVHQIASCIAYGVAVGSSVEAYVRYPERPRSIVGSEREIAEILLDRAALVVIVQQIVFVILVGYLVVSDKSLARGLSALGTRADSVVKALVGIRILRRTAPKHRPRSGEHSKAVADAHLYGRRQAASRARRLVGDVHLDSQLARLDRLVGMLRTVAVRKVEHKLEVVLGRAVGFERALDDAHRQIVADGISVLHAERYLDAADLPLAVFQRVGRKQIVARFQPQIVVGGIGRAVCRKKMIVVVLPENAVVVGIL